MDTTASRLAEAAPSLAEPGAVETLAALGWRGYQRHGRGAVFYAPAECSLYYRTVADLRRHAQQVRPEHAQLLGRIIEAAEGYDPHAAVVVSVFLTDIDRWITEVLTPPRPPALCRQRWKPGG